ncbi:unnamed protein product [Cunninghamella blakesleeana]
MLTAKFTSLSEDFYQYTQTGSTATLNKLMLHPWNPPATEHDTNIVSVLLRTKLIPTIEAIERDTTKVIQQEIKSNPTDNNLMGRKDQDQLTKEQLDQWKQLRERHDRLATDASNFIQELINQYRDAFLVRLEEGDSDEEDEEEEEDGDEQMDLENDTIMNSKKKKEKEDPDWKKQGFQSEEAWKKYKLECMMTFYSMGKNELATSDLKPK